MLPPLPPDGRLEFRFIQGRSTTGISQAEINRVIQTVRGPPTDFKCGALKAGRSSRLLSFPESFKTTPFAQLTGDDPG
jgi:hypothetical protein